MGVKNCEEFGAILQAIAQRLNNNDNISNNNENDKNILNEKLKIIKKNIENCDKDLLNRLNGKIHLILGNHDYPVRKLIASETKIELCAENALYSDDKTEGR